MKKILAIFVAAVLSVAMTSCGKKNGVDMKKVDGQALESVAGEKDAEANGTVAGMELTVKEAKLIDYEGRKVAVISIDVKNTNSSAKAYSDLLSEDVTQDGSNLNSVLITEVEGVNLMAKMDKIESGKKETVQVAYAVNDETAPIEIMIYEYAAPGGEKVTKSFNLK